MSDLRHARKPCPLCDREMPPGPLAVHMKVCKGPLTIDAVWEQGSVDRSNPDQCWEWHGPRMTNGRPLVKWPGVGGFASRIIWQLVKSPIPDGLNVLHTCDVGDCVNPNHFWLGTQSENILDCSSKGRWANPWDVAGSREKRSGDSHWTRRRDVGKEHAKTMLTARWKNKEVTDE